MPQRLQDLEGRLARIEKPEHANEITADEARGGIGESLERTDNVGLATPLISAGILAEHTLDQLKVLVQTARGNPDGEDTKKVVDFLMNAIPYVKNLHNYLVKAVTRTGAAMNFASGIERVAERPVLGVEASGMRYLVVVANAPRTYGSQVRDLGGSAHVVRHYGHIVEQPRDHQESGTRLAEYNTCASRGKKSCDESLPEPACASSGCSHYQDQLRTGKPKVTSACGECAFYTASAKPGLPSGSPKSSCDHNHAIQGLVVGAIADLAGMRRLEKIAKGVTGNLTNQGKTTYGSALSTVADNMGHIAQFSQAYLNELSPVTVSRDPWN